MLTALLTQYGKWLLLLGIVACAVAVINAIRAGRRSRAATYYAVRQESLSKTRRWSLAAVVMAVIAGGFALVLSQLPAPATTVARVTAPTPPNASIATRPLPTAVPTDTPTIPPSATPLPPPTSTPTLAPTPTPPPGLPAILQTPLPLSVPPAPNAKLEFTTLASLVKNNAPIDPGLAFPAGTRTIRLFFQASRVNNNAAWSVLCYKGDQLVDSIVTLWKWGTRAQAARAFCSLDGSAGDYLIEVYLGPNKQFEVGFELLPATPAPKS